LWRQTYKFYYFDAFLVHLIKVYHHAPTLHMLLPFSRTTDPWLQVAELDGRSIYQPSIIFRRLPSLYCRRSYNPSHSLPCLKSISEDNKQVMGLECVYFVYLFQWMRQLQGLSSATKFFTWFWRSSRRIPICQHCCSYK